MTSPHVDSGPPMLISFFAHRRLRQAGGPWVEADRLEDRLGREGAIDHIRDLIAAADRSHRRRLYQLHDELARREPGPRRAG